MQVLVTPSKNAFVNILYDKWKSCFPYLFLRVHLRIYLMINGRVASPICFKECICEYTL